MIKSDLIHCVIDETGLSKHQAEIALDTILGMLKDAMVRGERIELRGFGVFEIRPRKTGVGRNPRTREEFEIPRGMTVRFKPGKRMMGA